MARRIMPSQLALAVFTAAFSAAVASGFASVVDSTILKPTPAPYIVVKADYIFSESRCTSCLQLEKWSAAAIKQGLADSIRTGRLIWASESMDTPQGSALADQLGLMASALVLMELRDGKMTRFKELKKTWNHLGDSTALAAYVKSETLAFMNAMQ